jgi:hypothetical protein
MQLTASVIGSQTQGQTSIRLVSWQVQRVDPPEDHISLAIISVTVQIWTWVFWVISA